MFYSKRIKMLEAKIDDLEDYVYSLEKCHECGVIMKREKATSLEEIFHMNINAKCEDHKKRKI
jgi:hypothetical protein